MAKLPTLDEVPFVAPDANRPIGNVNTTGIGEGIAALGTGAQKLGYDIQLGDARADAFDVAARKTDFLVGKTQLDDQYQNDPNAKPEQYQTDINALRDKTMQGLSPRATQQLNNHIAPSIQTSIIGAQRLASTNQAAAVIQQNDERANTVVNQIVALPPGDPRRAELMDSYSETLRGLPLTPKEYKQRASQFVMGVAKADVQAAINSNDPKRLQDAIDGLEKARTSQPSSQMDDWKQSISKIESGGNYKQLGPLTGSGDRAYGKYQVMGNNIPEWTQAALGKSMSPQQFLNDQKAQDAVFENQFGGYVKQYGSPQQAASVWFTGKPINAQSASARDVLGTSGASYVNQFTSNLGGGKSFRVAGDSGQQPKSQDGNIYSLMPAYEREQLLSHAYQGQKAQIADQGRVLQIQKQQQQNISDDAENAYRQKIFSADGSVQARDIVGDPQLTREAQDRLIAITNRANKPEPPAQVSSRNTMQILSDIRRNDNDPAKINSVDPIYKAYTDGAVSKGDFEFLTKQFDQAKTSSGETLPNKVKELSKAVRPLIDKSFLDPTDETGPIRHYAWEQDATRKIEEYRKSGKNPYDLFDPSKPDFLGSPDVMKQYQSSMQQKMWDKATVVTTRSMPKESPVLPDANARTPGEGIDAWIKRTGKGGPDHLPVVPISR